MKATYRVTLLRLSRDASSIEPLNHLPMELGEVAPADLLQLLENLAKFDVLTIGEDDPVIVIRRGDQGWRVTPGTRCLMFHDGTGTLDPVFPLDPAGILTAIAPGGTIPPFRVPPNPAVVASEDLPACHAPRRSRLKAGEILIGIILVILLVAFGIWLGLRLHKPPAPVPAENAGN